ncbi:MAG: DNA repair protein RecO [Bacteroidales bacterium]|nr:DNA repair protein RecO [Bacteroidales bacterium]
MIIHTRAIILNHLRYGESSLIAHLYTELLGRQAIFVQGVYSKKSQMRAALFQPLHIVETEIHHRDNRRMQRISHIRLLQPFHDLLYNPVKNGVALFIAEILGKTLKEEESNRDLFDFLLRALQTLDLIETGVANFHMIFLIHYTRYLGFYPNPDELPENAPPLLMQLLNLPFEHLESLQISRHQRNCLTEYLLSYYAGHVDNFGKMNSFIVLRHLFS